MASAYVAQNSIRTTAIISWRRQSKSWLVAQSMAEIGQDKQALFLTAVDLQVKGANALVIY